MKESELLKLIMDYLSAKRIFHVRINTGAFKKGDHFIRFGAKGMPDIVGIAPGGRFLGIECKVKPNKPSEEQREFLQTIKANGGIGILAYSLEDVEAGLWP